MKRLEGGPKRVLVAMSGGVDSSTVAGLLVEQGHDVIGVMMKLYDGGGAPGADRQCCGLDDVDDARRVADRLGIPFYVVDYQREFRSRVIDRFVDAYVNGETPNPCVQCNDRVKFEPLLERAMALGADYLATGHYARSGPDATGRVGLWRGRDAAKDQSYFLAGIAREALERVVFPLGDLTKDEVREQAERLALPVAGKQESQEICFVPNDDYVAFVESEAGGRLRGGGPLVSLDGTRLGQHKGLHRYTVGQRRGLGLSNPEPLYVARLERDTNSLVVGSREQVRSDRVWARDVRWLEDAPTAGAEVLAQIRYRHRGVQATLVSVEPGGLVLALSEPVTAVSPGQQLVLYEGDRVVGSATIVPGEPGVRAGEHAEEVRGG